MQVFNRTSIVVFEQVAIQLNKHCEFEHGRFLSIKCRCSLSQPSHRVLSRMHLLLR
jgi:hypothetical protein